MAAAETEMTLSSTIYEEILIEKVRCFVEHLWKVTSNKFKDVQYADLSWHRITAELHELGFKADSNNSEIVIRINRCQ